MTRRSRMVLTWGLRLLLLALIVFVVARQVNWDDRVVLLDRTVLGGYVVASDEASIRMDVRTRDGAAIAEPGEQVLPRAEIAPRAEAVPDVTYGFRTLARQVARQPWVGAAVLLALFLIVVLTGVRWQRLVAALGLPLPAGEAIRLNFIGGFFNMVVPGATGGDVVRAYYAARRTGAPTRAVLSVFVDRALGVFILVLVSFVALFAASDGEGYRVARVTAAGLLAGGVLAIALIASRRLRRGLGLSALIRRLPFQRVVQEVSASIRLYRGHPWNLAQAALISVANQAGIAVVIWALAGALGIQGVGLGACLALVPLINLLSAVPLVPGGWGVGELVFAYFFGQIGVPATEAVGLSVIYRLSFLLVNLPGGMLWLFVRGHPSRETIATAVEEAADRVADLAEDDVGSREEPSASNERDREKADD